VEGGGPVARSARREGAAGGLPVRRAGPADLDALVELWLEMTRHHQDLDPYFRLRPDARGEVRRLMARELEDPDAAAWLAGDPPAGFCVVRIDRAPPIQEERERAEITDLGVRPGARRAGIGRDLVEAALAWVRGRGVARVEIRVAVRNAEGQAFWRALGFGDFMDVLQRRL
jgi:ribosomal protein S18 acetylase RimI-like enzyme